MSYLKDNLCSWYVTGKEVICIKFKRVQPCASEPFSSDFHWWWWRYLRLGSSIFIFIWWFSFKTKICSFARKTSFSSEGMTWMKCIKCNFRGAAMGIRAFSFRFSLMMMKIYETRIFDIHFDLVMQFSNLLLTKS